MYVTLEQAKAHLNVESSFTEDDAYITSLIGVAEDKVAKELCVSVDDLETLDGGEGIPYPIYQAILLSIGTYYRFREDITTVETKRLVQGALYLIQMYRDYTK